MVVPPRRIAWLAGGAAAVLAVGILIQQQTATTGKTISDTEPPVVRKTSGPADSRPGKPTRQLGAPAIQNLPDLPSPIEPPHAPGSPENQDWITQRISELDDLAWYDDPESLGKILTELRNPLLEIRAAALSATRAFGSRDAIPYLAAISRETKDPLEQKAIADLIEHLNLPTVLEQVNGDFD